MASILIADPDPTTRAALQEYAAGQRHGLFLTDDGRDALRLLAEEDIDLIIAEQRLSGMDGLSLLREVRQKRPDVAVILLAAFGTVEDAVAAMRDGAADFLSKPFAHDEMQVAVDKALDRLRLLQENRDLREALDDRVRLDNLIATDPRMQAIFKIVKVVASSRTTVLITGESGTGKTLLARAIHKLSGRHDRPFVEVNCGALPESLLESELFGHVRGAFTGAVKDRPGKFEAAHGGTIFLDEIGTSSPGFQVKLLRVLQDRVLERVGDSTTIPVDVRIILATNQNLEQAVQEGRFREDLYYRIHVVTMEMPPLRERPGDIPFLAEHFLRRFNREASRRIRGFSALAMDVLMRARWPGNVRQLENVVERAVVLAEQDQILPGDLPPGLTAATPSSGSSLALPIDAHLQPLKQALEAPEKLILERALAHHHGNRLQTAQSLGINRSTLFNKMRRFGLL